ncbi:C2 calcium-dependent domain-containing protein 4D-like [Mantella aurantiaca]
MFCTKKKPLPSCPNILTPDQIPSFTIPPKLAQRAGGHAGGWFQKKALEAGSKPAARALMRSASRHVIQVEEVEREAGSPQLGRGADMASTIMGGPYLSESPHTRRRESLFHQMCPCELPPDFISGWRASSHDLLMDSDTASSAESSPFSSPLLNRPSGKPPASSLTVKTLTRASSLSTEETSSADTSPNLPTKEDHPPSMARLLPPPIYHLDFICLQDRLTKETEVALGRGGGLARLSAEYAGELGRLRVKLVSAENLYPARQDPRAISCCAVLCLMPGKLQKQRSTVIRRSRNPIFNEDFYFEGLGKEELGQRRLRVKVVNRGGGVKRDVLLGANEVQLSAILPP